MRPLRSPRHRCHQPLYLRLMAIPRVRHYRLNHPQVSVVFRQDLAAYQGGRVLPCHHRQALLGRPWVWVHLMPPMCHRDILYVLQLHRTLRRHMQ